MATSEGYGSDYSADQASSLELVKELGLLLQKYGPQAPFIDDVVRSSRYAARPEREMPELDRAMFLQQADMVSSFRAFLEEGRKMQGLAIKVSLSRER